MTKEDFLMSIEMTFKTAFELLEKKNHDYSGNSCEALKNFLFSADFVNVPIEKAIMIRFLDKMSRISSLLDRPEKVKEESIYDTIIDAINYLAIIKAVIEDKFDRKNLKPNQFTGKIKEIEK